MKPGMHLVKDRLPQLAAGVASLTSLDVLVGVPAETAMRGSDPINNAVIGYLNERGSPGSNLPARPHLFPGIRKAKTNYLKYFRQAIAAALKGDKTLVARCLAAAGMVASNEVKSIIRAGLEPPLKASTIKKRQRRSPGSRYRRKATTASQVVPLIDTGAYLRSITYVLRMKSPKHVLRSV